MYFYRLRLFFLAGIAILIIVFAFFYQNKLRAPDSFKEDTIIHIENGQPSASIADELVQFHIIRSALLFKIWISLVEGKQGIVAGDYVFEKTPTLFEVAYDITNGKSQLAPIKVTFPEGSSINDMAFILLKKIPDFNAPLFVARAQGKEGYLFPDTYLIPKSFTVDQIIGILSNTFVKKITPLADEIKNSKKSQEEIITMASILEEEGKTDSDRKIISGILWKRIDAKIALQVDVAPETYTMRGLPKNPITNPGLESIEAALNPTETSYYYYLSDKNGTMHYAKTYEEHLVNISKYLK